MGDCETTSRSTTRYRLESCTPIRRSTRREKVRWEVEDPMSIPTLRSSIRSCRQTGSVSSGRPPGSPLVVVVRVRMGKVVHQRRATAGMRHRTASFASSASNVARIAGPSASYSIWFPPWSRSLSSWLHFSSILCLTLPQRMAR